MEHAFKIETAFANYLSGIIPSPFNGVQIFIGENNLDKTGARIVAYVPDGTLGEEDPPLSGNRYTDVTVDLRTPFSKLTPKQISDGVAEPLDTHRLNAAALEQALFSVTLPDQLTASADGFTCFGIVDRQPMRSDSENYWSSSYQIRIYSCASAFQN